VAARLATLRDVFFLLGFSNGARERCAMKANHEKTCRDLVAYIAQTPGVAYSAFSLWRRSYAGASVYLSAYLRERHDTARMRLGGRHRAHPKLSAHHPRAKEFMMDQVRRLTART
jgi:hypothetical protein